MIKFEYVFHKDLDYNKYFKNKNVCFLDIETTGFSRIYNSIYLIGVSYYDFSTNNWILKQYFASRKNSEENILKELIKLIKDFDLIITYNGDSFDIPYIEARLKHYNIDFNIHSIESLDLFKFINRYKGLLNFENYKLKTVERNLDIHREDIYTGKDCIGFYKNYLSNQDSELLKRLLNHNYDDLFYLIDIVKITELLDELTSITIPYGDIIIKDIGMSGDIFSIEGNFYSKDSMKIMNYDQKYSVEIAGDDFKVEFEYDLGLVENNEKAYFVYADDFKLDQFNSRNDNHNVPQSILLIQVEKKIFVENLKEFIAHLINKSIKNFI